MDKIIEKLRDKDEKSAYEFARRIGIESVESNKYVEKIPVFSEMLTDKNSYVRTRAFMLICNQARWADNGQIEVILYRPEMIELIRDAVNNIDLSAYKDSMSPLIKKDMDALLKSID